MWNNEILMQYNNANTTIPQYIKTFMRIVGIYVHEEYLEKEKSKWPNIVIGDLKYSITQDNKEEILNIINFFYNKNLITDNDKKVLYKLADIYDENNILLLILSTRYNMIQKDLFKTMSKKFENMVDIIISVNENSYYRDFSIYYLAFECNYSLSLVNERYIFNCNDLLNESNKLPNTLSKNLLIGQIFEEFLNDTEKAKEYYFKTDSAFSFYRLGKIYLKIDKRYTPTKKWFNKALEKNPYYNKIRYFLAGLECSDIRKSIYDDKSYYFYDNIKEEYEKIIFSSICNDYKKVSDYYLKYIAFIGLIKKSTLNRPGSSIKYYEALFKFYKDTKEISKFKEKEDAKLLNDWINSINIEEYLPYYEKMLSTFYRNDNELQKNKREKVYRLIENKN